MDSDSLLLCVLSLTIRTNAINRNKMRDTHLFSGIHEKILERILQQEG